jgi:hypothetical protein
LRGAIQSKLQEVDFMSNTRLTKRGGLLCFLSVTLTVLSIVLPSAVAQEKDLKDEETLKKVAVVLQGMLSRNDAPYGLENADCIVVLPNGGGRGMMSCRTGLNFSDSSTDLVLVITMQTGVDGFLNGKTNVGSRASVATRVASAPSRDCHPFSRCGK